MLKSMLKKISPTNLYAFLSKIKYGLKLFSAYWNDANRYLYNRKVNLTQVQMDSKLWISAHVLEKGLSLPSPRLGYGKAQINRLVSLLKNYSNIGFHKYSLSYQNSIAVIQAYIEFHRHHGYNVDDVVRSMEDIQVDVNYAAGAIQLNRAEVKENMGAPFDRFAQSRYSIRHFSEKAVDECEVRKAIEIARKTPSVCNRQSWKVYWVRDPMDKADLCELQNGNRGFGDQVDSFLVITEDLQTFFAVHERNQCYVDGGIYTMSLLYSLHFVGLGACPLNWCVKPSVDQALHQLLHFPASEVVITILAVGHIPEKVKVACSLRKSVEDTLIEVKKT